MAVAVAVPRDVRMDVLEEFLARLRHLNYSPATLETYRSRARGFLTAHPEIALEDFTPAHVDRYLTAKGYSPGTFSTSLEILRSFFRFLIDRKDIPGPNPCQGVQKPKAPLRTRPAPSEQDVAAMLRVCRTLEERVLVELLYRTGLRISEAQSVRWRDIDRADRMIKVIGKGSKERTVIFPEHTQALLEEFAVGRDPADWLFMGRQRRPRDNKTLQNMLHRIGEESGLPYRLTAHLLRHGWVRLCKVSGVPVDVTARLAGHSDIRTTSGLYGRLDISDLKAVYDAKLGGMGQKVLWEGNGQGNHVDLAIRGWIGVDAVRRTPQEVVCLTP